jgi:hypothetical protein
MGVVIHEIEVVPREQGQGHAAAGRTPVQSAEPAPPSAVGARDVFRIARDLRERALRVWAH